MNRFFNVLKSNWPLLAILAAAFFFRFFLINHLPGGLFPDEAANGLDVNSMAHGQLQPFYERGNGREALFFYFEALAVWLFGRGVWQFHIVSAAFGFASVIAVYFLTKRMFGKKPALLAAFLLAVSSYAVTVSRTAFRANTVPLISALTLLFLIKFFQSRDDRSRYWSAGLSGLFFGLGFYTYTSFRMMLPLLIVFGILIALGFRDRLGRLIRQFWRFKLVFVAAFLISISWLLSYFIRHPGSFAGRAGEVSIFNPDLNHGSVVGTFLEVLKKTILAFFTSGDLNWRHNVSGFPFLSPFISPFFAIGLIVFSIAMVRILIQAWRKKLDAQTFYMAGVAVWFWFMLAPEVTTAEGIPHGLRLTGVIPPLFIITAWSIDWIWQKLLKFHAVANYRRYFAAIFLGGIFVYNFYLYFAVAASSPDYYYAFRSDLTTVSDYLNRRNQKNKTYLSLDAFSVQTVEYLTTNKRQPYILVDPAHTYEVSLHRGDQVVFTESTIYDRLKFLQNHPQAHLVRETKNQFGQLIMLVYQQP